MSETIAEPILRLRTDLAHLEETLREIGTELGAPKEMVDPIFGMLAGVVAQFEKMYAMKNAPPPALE